MNNRCLKIVRNAVLLTAILVAGYYAKAQTSQGDSGDAILLIDVNNVIPEIEVIEKYLQQNEPGTKLVVIPSYNRVSREARKQIQDLHMNGFDQRVKYVENNYGNPALTNSEAMKSAMEKNRRDREFLTSLTQGTGNSDGQIHLRELQQELEAALNSGLRFSRVIISGHHSADPTNGYLSGELLAGVQSNTLKPILNSNRALEDSVRSVIMLGCWTGLENMMTTSWGTLLPRAKFHSGFITPAPLKTDPNNLNTLESILKSEKIIGESKSEAELQQNYKRIRLNGRNIGVMVDGMYISNTGRVKRLNY